MSNGEQLAEAIKRILQQAPKPLNVERLRDARGELRVGEDDFRQALLRLLDRGEVHRWPPVRGKECYWSRAFEEKAREGVLSALAGGPLTWAALQIAARKFLPGCPKTPADQALKEARDALLAEGRIFRHPKTGRRGERFGLTPADPRLYLKEVRKAIRGVLDKLGKAGVAPGAVHAAIGELLHLPVQPVGEPIEQLAERIYQTIPVVEPSAPLGAMATAEKLRRRLDPQADSRDAFDRAVLLLARNGKVDLHKMYMPESSMTDRERQVLVRDEEGNYYVGVTLRGESR